MALTLMKGGGSRFMRYEILGLAYRRNIVNARRAHRAEFIELHTIFTTTTNPTALLFPPTPVKPIHSRKNGSRPHKDCQEVRKGHH